MTLIQCESDAASSSVNVALLLEGDPDLDSEQKDQLTRRLREELLQLEVDSVDLAKGASDVAGAKVADPVTLGAIIVALSAPGGVLPTLIATVRDWLRNSSKAHEVSITIGDDKIDIGKATSDQQQALVDAFCRRHSTGGAGSE